MFKKSLILFICLLSSLSVSYMYFKNDNHNLNASTNKYNVGGTVTGRVNMAPKDDKGTVLTGNHFGLQAGDHVMIGGDNPYTGNPLSFQLLLYDENYTDYNNTDVINEVREPIANWLTASDEEVTGPYNLVCGTTTENDIFAITDSGGSNWFIPSSLSSTINGRKVIEFNQYLTEHSELSLFAPRNLQELRLYSSSDAIVPEPNRTVYEKATETLLKDAALSLAFMLYDVDIAARSDVYYNIPAFSSKFTSNMYMFSKSYYIHLGYRSVNGTDTSETAHLVLANQTYEFPIGCANNNNFEKSQPTYRPFSYLDLSNIVFGLAPSKAENITEDSIRAAVNDTFTIDPDARYDKQGGDSLKLRMLNSEMNVRLNSITNKDGVPLTSVKEGGIIYLNVTANAGKDHVISALFFNDENHLVGYQPLASTKDGTHAYALDTTGLGVQSYKIAVVNEVYDESSFDPTYSSKISDALVIGVEESVKITVSPKTGLVYGTNVNNGDTVAIFTLQNQTSPVITSVVRDDSVKGHEDDYKYFSVSSNTVIVNQPNGLDAGDYYFKLNVIDEGGDLSGGINSKTVHITVDKADITLAFTNPNETKKSITEAATSWNETATATPNTGVKITYSKTGGTISLIDINANTGAITYKGNNAYGKVKIQALADDDPSTGKDNYNPATVEKEIMIYRQVDAKVTPDSNSSDSTVPTFTTDKPNIKTGGIIGTIQGILGTPDVLGESTVTYKYTLKTGEDSSVFEVDSSTGVIKSKADLGVDSYTFTITVSDNWSSKDIKVTVNVGTAPAEVLKFYENSTSNIAITSKTVKATDTNVSVFATVKGSTNTNPVTYKIKDGSANVITINSDNGSVVIKGVGTVIIVAEKQGVSGQANASAELTFTVTSGEQEFIYTDSGGNELPKLNDKYKAYEEVYGKNKTFQLYTAGNPTGSTVTYRLKASSPNDVISVDSNGLVHILNASLNTQMGKVIVEATSHDPSGNYSDKTIELPINIKKADQTISFADVTYAVNGEGKVTPVINEQDISSNDGGVTVNDTDYYITIDSSISTSIAWTNNGVDIEYNYTGNGIDIPLHVEKAGNRNYNKAEANGSMHIMGPDENTLAINRPGKIVYGDHFTIKSLQDDSSSTNVKYTFEVDNTTYVSSPTVSGNKAEFEAIRYSGSTSISIKVTRTADGETTLSKTVTIQVLPKEIEIVIDNKTKNKGEQNPALTYQDFRNDLVSWNGVKDVIQENDIKLSTTAKTDSGAGAYPITGDSNFLNKTYPNYSFKFKDGTLTINEDNIQDDWYHLELEDGKNTIYKGEWTNKDVNIISDHNEYVNMSLDQSTWKPSFVTVTKEGETNQSFWMKKDNGTITKEKKEIIRIDKTVPRVKSIKGKDTTNKLQNIMNQLSLKVFFRPGTSFEINTDDSKDGLKVSGTKEIAYKVFKLEKRTRAGEELVKEGTLKVTNEKASIVISDSAGVYKLCVIPTDNAENTNAESCHEIEIKKIDVDVDDDGKPDFNDPDGDGCPDLNIKWKDPETDEWIVINGDRDGDGIPDLNIDSDGDGKADLNVDTDGDGKPDLNLVILKKGDWKPTICVNYDPDKGIYEEYCTGTNVKAVINVDTDGDGIPNINIDNVGDFKPHINISKDGINPIINITTIHEWVPKNDYKSNKFIYDSIGKNAVKPELNIDTDGDGRPDINIDLDGDGIPDLNIDWDGDWIPDTQIDSDGDGKPDINIDTDGNGIPDENIVEIKEWKPNKNVDGDFPYDTMDFSEPDADDDNPSKDDDTDVKGNYYPGKDVGGAMTGDDTDCWYLWSVMISFAVLCVSAYRYRKSNQM